MPWSYGDPPGDPMILFARATLRYTRPMIHILDARIDYLENQQRLLSAHELYGEEIWWEEWLALKRCLIEHETQFYLCIMWRDWANAYRGVRPLV